MKFIHPKITSLSALASLLILSGCDSNDSSSQSSDQGETTTMTSADQSKTSADTHSHEGGDDHHHAKVPGPNGGRLIVDVEPHLEFLVLPDHHAQITFVNDEIQPIPPVDLDIKLVGGDRSAPIEIGFEQKENVLRSTTALPKEHNVALVLQIAGKTLTETVFERFHLNM